MRVLLALLLLAAPAPAQEKIVLEAPAGSKRADVKKAAAAMAERCAAMGLKDVRFQAEGTKVIARGKGAIPEEAAAKIARAAKHGRVKVELGWTARELTSDEAAECEEGKTCPPGTRWVEVKDPDGEKRWLLFDDKPFVDGTGAIRWTRDPLPPEAKPPTDGPHFIVEAALARNFPKAGEPNLLAALLDGILIEPKGVVYRQVDKANKVYAAFWCTEGTVDPRNEPLFAALNHPMPFPLTIAP